MSFFEMYIIFGFSFLDRHQVWRSHDPMSGQTFDYCEKKTQLYRLVILLYHAFCYPPIRYPPGYLMLTNPTNQFIKLSDGDLQCK